MAPFGKVLPVIGLNNGFPGQVSRTGERVIAARQVLSTTPSAVNFGDTMVLVPDAAGGTYQTVADFIAGSGTMTAALFAGIAVREVKTAVTYPYTPGQPSVSKYLPGEIAEVLERGSIVVPITVGASSAVAGGPVYLRIALNGSIPAGVVGDLEGAADGSNTISLASVGVVFRTGVVDANGNAEITLKNRVAA